MSEGTVFPGQKIASIEEYEAGHNTFDDGNMVIAATVGDKDIDKDNRVINIEHPKLLSIPRVGDIIIGTVAIMMSSMMAVSIDYINGKPTTSKVECICSTRNLRIRNIALANDIVQLKIINHLNGTIHAAISEPNLGVLFTKCRKCGCKVVPMRDAIKCIECGWIDERKLASTFGSIDCVNLRE